MRAISIWKYKHSGASSVANHIARLEPIVSSQLICYSMKKLLKRNFKSSVRIRLRQVVYGSYLQSTDRESILYQALVAEI